MFRVYGVAYRDVVHTYRQPRSGQSRVYRVAQLPSDGIHCRESTGTEPVALKVVEVRGAVFLGSVMDQYVVCSSLFLHTLLVCSGYSMCDTESIGGGVVPTVWDNKVGWYKVSFFPL